jgi:hypothetical protein
MGLRYRFRRWAEDTIGSTEAATVRGWFLEQGLDAPRQTWRKFLTTTPKSCQFATWVEICEVTGEPLETFIQIVPSGRRATKGRFRATKSKTKPKPATAPKKAAPALPPRPSEFAARRNDG